MDKLKLSLDRQVLYCLSHALLGMAGEVASIILVNRCHASAFYLLMTWFKDMASKAPKSDEQFKVKIDLPLALALSDLFFRAIPVDEYTNARLVELSGQIERYLITSIRTKSTEPILQIQA